MATRPARLFWLFVVPAAVLLSSVATARAQTDTPFRITPRDANPAPSPYVGFETRDVKTLAPERIAGLRAGAGLGYALAAELNGQPGPMHVLEMANRLELTPDQTRATQRVFEAMRKAAVEAGEALIAAEAHLDRMFQMRHATFERVNAQTAVIAAQEARLRAIHLNAHLEMMDILTPAQIESYSRLRGYQAAGAHQGQGVHGGAHGVGGHGSPAPPAAGAPAASPPRP
jgi:Spy/CpxP family protein refolding chaperone